MYVIVTDTKGRQAISMPLRNSNTLCNLEPGKWLLTLHNPTEREIQTRVQTSPQWTVFKLAKQACTVPAGSSVDIEIH